MKMSTAILKGCKGTKKACGAYSTPKGRFCALGAMGRGGGLYHGHSEADQMANLSFYKRHFPDLSRQVAHPISVLEEPIYSIIISLNDTYHWSRERIARWLKKIGY